MNSIIFGDKFVSFSDSLYITVISMSIVFSVLVLICFFVACMKYIPQDTSGIDGSFYGGCGRRGKCLD